MVVGGERARHDAHPARSGGGQAQERDVVRRRLAHAAVIVHLEPGRGQRPARVLGERLAVVAHVVDDRARPLLRHRRLEQVAEEPVEIDGLLPAHAIERQAVEDGRTPAPRRGGRARPSSIARRRRAAKCSGRRSSVGTGARRSSRDAPTPSPPRTHPGSARGIDRARATVLARRDGRARPRSTSATTRWSSFISPAVRAKVASATQGKPECRRRSKRTQGPQDAAAAVASDERTQRVVWSGATWCCGGTSATHRSSAWRQRGAKAQPGGSARRSGGAPGMAGRRWPRAVVTVEPSSPSVYGCRGWRITASVGPVSTKRPAYMTARRSAISTDTPDVVGDEDHRHAQLALH